MSTITRVATRDARYPIGSGHGSDTIHEDPVYSYAATLLHDDAGRTGTGLAFTLGEGNQRVCEAARFYAQRLIGHEIEEVMADFGALQKAMADEVDAARVAGVSEFLAVSLLCLQFGVPVVPHVGDMGQLHQHLVLFNHIALGHEVILLEHIPHLRAHFIHPCRVEGGVYSTPQEPGSSCDLKPAG